MRWCLCCLDCDGTGFLLRTSSVLFYFPARWIQCLHLPPLLKKKSKIPNPINHPPPGSDSRIPAQSSLNLTTQIKQIQLQIMPATIQILKSSPPHPHPIPPHYLTFHSPLPLTQKPPQPTPPKPIHHHLITTTQLNSNSNHHQPHSTNSTISPPHCYQS